jgi:putative transposase
VLHLVNRGNDRKLLFTSPDEYEDFLGIIDAAKSRGRLRLIAYCLMPNHWHLLVWPETATDVSSFCHWVGSVHGLRHRRATQTIGRGHLYQDRYHSFAVESERQYYEVIRYVEANPVRAGLVAAAADWPWSSLTDRLRTRRGLLNLGPLPLPPEWETLVNQSLPQDVLDDLRTRCGRTKPYDLRGQRRPVAETAAKSR